MGEGMRIQTTKSAGAAVRSARLARNWSQQRLADAAGVSREWVSALERGKSSLDFRLFLDVVEVLGLELTIAPNEAALADPHESAASAHRSPAGTPAGGRFVRQPRAR